MLKSVLIASALASSAFAAAAQEAAPKADGFAACMVLREEGEKLFFYDVGPANQAKAQPLALRFAQYLRVNEAEKNLMSSYGKMDRATVSLTADCRWYKTQAEADAKIFSTTNDFRNRGYNIESAYFFRDTKETGL